MTDRLLNRNSNNIAALIALVTLHEENIARHSLRHASDNSNLISLLTPLFNMNIDVSGEYTNPPTPITPVINTNNNTTVTSVLNTTFGDIIDPLNFTCPITHEDFVNTDQVTMVLSCRHIFKRASFLRWINQNNRCPCCRVVIHSDASI